ncbi:MAG: HD domain-containing phosphohydrolase [Bacillota bacterium]
MAELTERVQKLQGLLEISRELNSYLKGEDLLRLVLERAMEVSRAEAGTLWLLEEDGYLVPLVARGPKADGLKGLRLKPGEGLAGQVVQNDEPRLVADVRNDPGWASRFDQSTGFITRSILCVPLRARREVIGCLQLINKMPDQLFDEDDLEISLAFAGHAAIALENGRLFAQLNDLLRSLISALTSSLDARDPYTRGHSERVSGYVVLTAKKLGYTNEALENIERAALLHDIGKIGIRDNVLLQEGPLDKEKWETMKTHPLVGARILENVVPTSLVRGIMEGALYHQEKFDGTGYPQGLRGEDIPLVGRIIAVCDTFDAITTDRPYRKGASIPEALQEIRRCAGTHFDTAVAEAFCLAVEEKEGLQREGENNDHEG